MTRKEAERQTRQMDTLRSLGFTRDEAEQLRRISMTLHRWHERECGDGNGCIERDDTTGKAYWLSANSGRRFPIADREKGAHKRLAAIIGQRNGRPAIVNGELHPTHGGKVTSYIQGDPRGAALYIIRPGDVPEGQDVNGYYSRGICVY